MSSSPERPADEERQGPVRAPQSLYGGLALIALAALALYLTSDLSQGTLRTMGPAMLPRWLAIGVGACGVALLVLAFVGRGDAIERSGVRGPIFVLLAILAFAVTIRPFAILGITTPGLGLVFAGPLAVFIGGFATPEMRLRELVLMSLTLIPFCMLLFGDALGLAIPMFPQAIADLFPAGWSQKLILRTMAAAMVAAAAVIFFLTRGRPVEPVKVPDHSGRI